VSTTSIEWATHVWNPVTGCDRVSPGCAHCYALTFAARLKAMGKPQYQRDGGKASGPGFAVTCHPQRLGDPARWRKPRPRVFVNSMSDLFHDEVPGSFIGEVWRAMFNAPQHNYLILTKRPERLQRWTVQAAHAMGWPVAAEIWPPWVWLGVSIENRRFIHRADLLRDTPTSGPRFISAEPLLGPLLRPATGAGFRAWTSATPMPDLSLEGIDWLIVGGESGPGFRPVDVEWIRDLRDAAIAADVAFFFKQWGGQTPKAGGRELDGRTWDEFPTGHQVAIAA
jgi:protein gp37